MFGWFKKPKEAVENWRQRMERENEPHEIIIPATFVIKVPRENYFSYGIGLREDVVEWCRANEVRHDGVIPTTVIGLGDAGVQCFGPYRITIRGDRVALFKLVWFDEINS